MSAVQLQVFEPVFLRGPFMTTASFIENSVSKPWSTIQTIIATEKICFNRNIWNIHSFNFQSSAFVSGVHSLLFRVCLQQDLCSWQILFILAGHPPFIPKSFNASFITFVQALAGICVWVVRTTICSTTVPLIVVYLYHSWPNFLWRPMACAWDLFVCGIWLVLTSLDEKGRGARRVGVGFTSSWEWQKMSTH